jgi:KipI family sensor histidine kinase inhibitor
VRLREVGDSALLLEIGSADSSPAGIDVAVNRRVIAIARAIRERSRPGVRDVISTFRSVAVFFHPLSTDVAALAGALHECSDAQAPDPVGKRVEVPVEYGGEAGPDLEAVAAFARCTTGEVIERHTSRTYRVCMLGFLPGFPYMAAVDDTIAVPRKPSPRVRVAAGSVGIAGRQTGIYPCDSPGGWQIIGRTALSLFDVDRMPPALFSPGDQVRFVPVKQVTSQKSQVTSHKPRGDASTGRFITVLRPGLLTTVQDSGRWGHQALGVPVAGPMDPLAHRLVNLLVNNPRDAATLEATLQGPELRVEQETHVAVGGGDLQPRLDGADLPMHVSVRCRKGAVLAFGGRRAGTRAYIAFDGGIDVPKVLGSRATHAVSGLGGVDGRPLKAGDRLPLGEPGADLKVGAVVGADLLVGPTQNVTLRILPGPQIDYFETAALEALEGAEFVVSPHSDRMGYRLTGGVLPQSRITGEMLSDVTFIGALQVPSSGDPILLMADRQTTGGYPQLAIVISADLPAAAQLAPGDRVRFERCTRPDALAALVAQEGRLLAVR